MKKYAKLLCAILVATALCASLLFTVGAEEGEEFVKSIDVTDYSGQSISNGLTIAKSEVAGNRVNKISTMNAGNSTFVSIAQGYGTNEHIIAYANRDVNATYTSSNNLAISVDTPNSDPFTVVGDGVQGYYVIDFDVATYGTMLPGFDVSVVLRRASDTGGFPFSDEILVGNFVKGKDAWAHVTIVGDLVNNVARIYVNGVYVGDGGKAVRNDQSNANQLASDTQVKALGYRVEFTRNNVAASMTRGDNVAFDNFAHRLFINDGDELGAAVASGDLTSWAGYTAGRGGELLPTLVKVEGTEYRNFADVSQAIVTNDTVDVEFLAQPFGPIPFCANANIDTHGMDFNSLVTLTDGCKVASTNGNVVTTTAPFVSNYSEKAVDFSGYSVTSANIPSIFNATKGDAVGNLYERFSIVTKSSLKNLGTLGYRNATIITDTVTGTSIYRESAYVSAGATATKENNEYSNFNFKKVQLSYEEGKNEYIVIDFDYTYSGTLDKIALLVIPRGNAGYHATSLAVKDLPVTEGEMVHITAVHDFTDNVAYYFVNGVLTNTVSGGAIKPDNHSNYLSGNESITIEEYKLGSNSISTVYFSNMNIRYFDVDQDADTIDTAITSKDITRWDSNIYTSDYKIASFPALATVDGVPYTSELQLESALYGNRSTPAVVKVLHAFEDVITVNCDATIYTYGQNVSFVDVNGRELSPDKTGVIRLDIPYMEVRDEEILNLNDTASFVAIYNAVKSGVSGNLLTAVVPSAGRWGEDGYRSSSLVTNIESGDVMYRNFATSGTVNADSTEYADMSFSATTFNYSSASSSYVVVDFDFATDRELTDGVCVVLVPASGASASAKGLLLKDLGILDGDMAHVTVVYDFTNNNAYAFVNGMYACSVEGGVLDSNANYLSGTAVTVDTFRLSTEGKTSAVCLDNVAVRAFTYEVSADALADAVDSGDITAWSDSVYNSSYKTAKVPTVAIIDGRAYGSIDTVNKVLAIKTNYVKQVEMKYSPDAAVKIRSEVTVETNGLDVELDWNTGVYEFDPGIERYRSTATGLAYASTQFIYTTVGTSYSFQTINAENCWNNASIVIWSYSIPDTSSGELVFHNYDVVFYPYGEKMLPFESGKFIENGKLNDYTWAEVHVTGKDSFSVTITSDFPVASPTEQMKIYYSRVRSTNTGAVATDMLYSANVSTDIEFVFYVNAAQTVTRTGEIVNIGGKDYVVFRYKLAPHEVDKVITVTFEVKDGDTVYTQKQDICFIDYARKLLEGNLADKSLLVSLLNYANEAHILFAKGDKNKADMTAEELASCEMKAAVELIEQYKAYLPNEALTAKFDTSALSSVIRTASLRLNSTPEFVFKVAKGFRGTITISYNSLGVPVEYSVYVNTLACEEFVTLKGMNIYDVAADITITVTPQGSDASVSCQYNLATYAQSLSDNDFAVALYNYAKMALQHHSEYVENKLPV